MPGFVRRLGCVSVPRFPREGEREAELRLGAQRDRGVVLPPAGRGETERGPGCSRLRQVAPTTGSAFSGWSPRVFE